MIVKNHIDELQPALDNGLGCIILDFGCYFPYDNQDLLDFSFSIGLNQPTDYKLNHRYPNKNYVTISKKSGRKLSKMGYPYFLELGEHPMLLSVTLGVRIFNEQLQMSKDYKLSMVFPIQVNLTKEKPVSALSFRFDAEKSQIDIRSFPKNRVRHWTNNSDLYEKYDQSKVELYLLNKPVSNGDKTLIFDDLITLDAQSVDDVWLW